MSESVRIQHFNPNEESQWGKPLYWFLDEHIKAVEGLIRADEIEMAFKLLEMIPAWYREPGNYPKELAEIKATLYKNLYDPFDYANDDEEAGYSRESAEAQFGTNYTYPRAEILFGLVNEINLKHGPPWICELSTSHGLLPLGLAKQGCRFNFFAKNLNHRALAKVIDWLGPEVWNPRGPGQNQKSIFVFTEALEHTYREEDLKNAYYKLGHDFDYLVLSVPYGCLGGGLPNWQSRRLGHIRGYTKQEFHDLAQKFFPGYVWEMIVAPSMVLVGKKSEPLHLKVRN